MFSSRVSHRSETRRSVIAVMVPLMALVTLAACGSSSESQESSEISEAPGTEAPAVGDETLDGTAGEASGSEMGEVGEIDGTDDLAGAIGGEELTNAIDALGIDTRMQIIADQLGGTYEVTSDTTAFLYLDGDANTDGLSVCFIVGAISSDGDRVIVAYPNGDVVCE
jgi:hypothetical protein